MGIVTRSRLYRKLEIFVRRKLGPVSLRSKEGLPYWRERIFHYFSIGVLYIGLVVFLFLGLDFLKDKQYIHLFVASFIFFPTVFVSLVKTLPEKFRVYWVVYMFFITGAYSLLYAESIVLGFVFLLAFVLLSGILIGQKQARHSFVIITLTLMAEGVIIYGPWMNGIFDHSMSFSMFIRNSVGFLIVVMITMLPLVSLINGLIFNLEKEKRLKVLLRREHEDLTIAKQKAEESDQLKSTFLANMSHEIRTPLNAINGFSLLLSHPDVSQFEKEEFINLIRLNGRNLITLMEDMIDISKIDSGQLVIKNTSCKLHKTMMEVYETFLEDIRKRGLFNLKIYLKEGISDENVSILTDVHRLKQILNNLVGNAIKFTEHGFVEFGYTLPNEQYIQFYVKDTGKGLPEGKESAVFNRFYKFSDDTSSKLYGGTGIGLTIVKSLVTMMGGEIWVESQPKVGTTFYFTLPYHRMNKVDNLMDNELVSKDSIRDFNWEGKTFLVAEDEEDNFRYIEVALALSNASLIWARDGQEAVDIFKRVDGIDLVLMDIKMPQMDGYTATKEIKNINNNIPVIAQTAYAMSEEKDKSLKAGCDDYIAKPIGYEDLLITINRYVPGN